MSQVTCLWEYPALLGEGPVYTSRENALYWVDIFGSCLFRISCDQKNEKKIWHLDKPLTSLYPRQPGGFIGTQQEGFVFIDDDFSQFEPITLPENNTQNRFNDGKIDRWGNYWAGSMDKAEQQSSGRLYRLDTHLNLKQMDQGYCISNGPTFSPCGQYLYHTDTIAKTIYAFDVDPETQAIRNKRDFIRFTREEQGYPDGMTVDAEGCLWVAHFRGACVSRYSPQGDFLQSISLPVPNITSCTFGGKDYKTLYMTTARHTMTAEEIKQFPLAGSLFTCEPGVIGMSSGEFIG